MRVLCELSDDKRWIHVHRHLSRLRRIAKSDCCLRRVRPSVCLFAWNNSAPTGPIFMKFDI
jgi:hypothetical protein